MVDAGSLLAELYRLGAGGRLQTGDNGFIPMHHGEDMNGRLHMFFLGAVTGPFGIRPLSYGLGRRDLRLDGDFGKSGYRQPRLRSDDDVYRLALYPPGIIQLAYAIGYFHSRNLRQ